MHSVNFLQLAFTQPHLHPPTNTVQKEIDERAANQPNTTRSAVSDQQNLGRPQPALRFARKLQFPRSPDASQQVQSTSTDTQHVSAAQPGMQVKLCASTAEPGPQPTHPVLALEYLQLGPPVAAQCKEITHQPPAGPITPTSHERAAPATLRPSMQHPQTTSNTALPYAKLSTRMAAQPSLAASTAEVAPKISHKRTAHVAAWTTKGPDEPQRKKANVGPKAAPAADPPSKQPNPASSTPSTPILTRAASRRSRSSGDTSPRESSSSRTNSKPGARTGATSSSRGRRQ